MNVRMASGKNRLSFRIYEWLHEECISVKSIASSIGITSTLVSSTIRGKKNSRRVLHRLIELGCPVKYLSLPKDMIADKVS